MSNGWKRDKQLSDVFIPEIKAILGGLLIGEPPVEEDRERNTDLIVLRLEAVRIGCRVRKSSYEARYGNEFTIRSSRPSGNKTELTKIVEGWGRYLFYGFGEVGDFPRLTRWTLCDLNVFRITYSNSLYNTLPMGIEKVNNDGSSNFHAFRISDFPSDFVVGCSQLTVAH